MPERKSRAMPTQNKGLFSNTVGQLRMTSICLLLMKQRSNELRNLFKTECPVCNTY